MIGIYCITNIVNGKKYYGQSINVKKRINDHKFSLNKNVHTNTVLQNAWNKYGEGSFIFSIVVECEQSELDDFEKEYILKNRTHERDYGYNIELGGNGRGKIVSEEFRKKCGVANIGNKYCLGRRVSESTRRKISNAGKGRLVSMETKRKMSLSRTRRLFSEETKKRISESKKGKAPKGSIGNKYCLGHKHSDETKEKMSKWHRGKTKSSETKKKMSEASKKKWENLANDVKEKILTRLRNPIITDETRKKMSAAAKKRRSKTINETSK